MGGENSGNPNFLADVTKVKGPRTDAEMRRDYLRYLGIQGDRSRAKIEARVTDKDIGRWRRDDTVSGGETFAQQEVRILNKKKVRLRKAVDKILSATDEDGFPKFPSQVMAAARLQLDEFKPPAQQVNHEVSGSIAHNHRHQAVLEAMPDHMLEEFIRTGKSPIEMDRIAEDVWSKK
jgi:hypothetical protein